MTGVYVSPGGTTAWAACWPCVWVYPKPTGVAPRDVAERKAAEHDAKRHRPELELA